MNPETYQEHLLRNMLECNNIPVHDDTCNIPLYQAVVEIPSIPAPVSPVDELGTETMMFVGTALVMGYIIVRNHMIAGLDLDTMLEAERERDNT